MEAISCSLMGYVIGSVNPAYLIARAKGFDIRKKGSGNAGASNALIVMGKKIGFISAILDIFKAFFVVKLAALLFPSFTQARVLAGVGCILGHIFPVFMGFRGGKGLASLGGMILALDLRVFLVMLLCEAIFALIVDYICVVPITASIILPFVYLSITSDYIGTAIFGVASLVMLLKHVENLKRIRKGTEAHLSFLWHREKEIKRLSGEEPTESVSDSEHH